MSTERDKLSTLKKQECCTFVNQQFFIIEIFENSLYDMNVKQNFILLVLFASTFQTLFSQTDYTSRISNPDFETGNSSGWNWTGATGYAWLGPNTDGDATKSGSFINGLWNASIGDVEFSQKISGLPIGTYQISALMTVNSNRITNQRLFATSGTSTKSTLYAHSTHPAYKVGNLNILATAETCSFAGLPESSLENGPFYNLSVIQQISDGTLTMGIRVSGKSTAKGYDFSHTARGDAGFFKFDHFRLTEVSDVATLDNITLSSGFLNSAFSPNVFSYTATLPEGINSITPEVKPTVPGVKIRGLETVDISLGQGTSAITVTALNGTTEKTYTIHYKVAKTETGAQQDKLYTDNFPLKDVTLLESPFRHALMLNIETLLKYDTDRLLAPYRKVAGLSVKAASYANWIGLDGHIGGHYLSALAIHYAATGNLECKNRMDYMVAELKACQEANNSNFPAWGVGYAGGVPSSANVWSTFKNGNFSAYNAAWVPWYNLHKTYAGLRDAWLYGGNLTARNVFLAFCDWAISITSQLTDAQMETMLNVEHGGMNEILADAYQITGSAKYLTAAKRFSHKVILNNMAGRIDNLDNMHANTQVPKAVGIARIAEVSKDATYTRAAEFFWQTVTSKRSLAFGGNSRQEYFPPASACIDYIHSVEGPESCNSNNMLKLTQDLFRMKPQAIYADYFERTLLNHILSTQHPTHGGYVYFTPARPQHYRVYSTPNQAMWCCVGTGMENHGKYGEFIYTHRNDSLYLNLFIASELNWERKGVKIRQETAFPESEITRLKIETPTPVKFTLMVRSPGWVKTGKMKIVVNTDTIKMASTPQTYIGINRTWNNRDSVTILLPMQNSIEQLPNVPRYVALMHGPVLLCAKTGTENLTGLLADDSRWGHIANGPLMPLDKAPVLVGDRSSLSEKIKKVEGESLTFKTENLFGNDMDSSLKLQPFYKIHDARYMMYWLNLTKDQYQSVLDSLALVQKAELELELRTLDKVAPGQQQPEVDHKMQTLNSYTGTHMNEFWRDARNGGFISYSMLTKSKSDLTLMVRYWGSESGSRNFFIQIDGTTIATENIVGKWNKNEFVNVEYAIPNNLIAGKDTVTVKFQAVNSSNIAGGIFYVRLLQPLPVSVLDDIDLKQKFKVFSSRDSLKIDNLGSCTNISIFDKSGKQVKDIHTHAQSVSVSTKTGFYLLKIVSDGETQISKVLVK